MSGPSNPKQRKCDYCGDFTALLYCRADSAKLCFFCDRRVHFPNQLFSKHTRAQLCDACGDSPASMLCSAENSVLCQNCDSEKHHHEQSQVHHRRPLEGFSGCPSVTQLITILGLNANSMLSISTTEGTSQMDGVSSLNVWNAPSVEDVIASTASSHENGKGAYRREKEEIISQLRELIKLEPDLINDAEREEQVLFGNFSTGFDRDVEVNMFPSYEAGVFCWHGENNDRANQIVPSDTSLTDYGEIVSAKDPSFTIPGTHTNLNTQAKPSHSFNSENLSATPKATPYSHERDSALLRYREKKKTRRYDKHIRYESRKVRAESRMRIKGRFVKDETQK
ncbi:hypothetical protein VNO78_20780 [Psophocarpus tetragonolobus]|uniref:Uncharacterized protein n=1 Tax=Psophocarpus tetragonolobus TaxID=3891 RepID=A0AAN9SC18_PSOTE